MNKRTTGLILTGILVTGAAGAVAITPASATTSDNAVASRLAGIKSTLSGLVTNGTLTQRITGQVNGVRPGRGPGRASRGAACSPSPGGTSSTPSSTT